MYVSLSRLTLPSAIVSLERLTYFNVIVSLERLTYFNVIVSLERLTYFNRDSLFRKRAYGLCGVFVTALY